MATKPKIVIADDEADILDLLEYNLVKEGFEVFRASNGEEALSLIHKNKPDIILLDIMMPNMNGIEVCRTIRTYPNFQEVAILFLTARTEEYSEIAGFEVGADDYITKPIKPRVLISRIKAVLRRNKILNDEKEDNQVVKVGNLEIRKEEYVVVKDKHEIQLQRKEFQLLCLLASKPGKIFRREELLDKIWQDVYVVDRTIDVHIRKIREKLGDNCIQTVKGVGYKFVIEEGKTDSDV